MPKTTDELYSELTQAQSLREFQQRNKNEARPPQAMEYLQALLKGRGMKPSQATSKAQIDDSYGRRLFNGQLHPGRKHLLLYAFAAGLTLDETQNLLKYAGFAQLYARDPREQLIIYALNNQLSIMETDAMLDDMHFKLLTA